MKAVQPAFLKPGDTVGIISTARRVSREEIEPAVAWLRHAGLEVILGAHLFSDSNQFAGTDEERMADLQWAMDHPQIKAIFCARGGYGTPRIVDGIRWDKFSKAPKWIVGFSDVTVLLQACYAHGICSLHAPMPLFFSRPEYASSMDKLKEYLFGNGLALTADPHPLNRMGEAEGVLLGGNLSLLVNSIGTPSSFQPEGKILFLEDIDEYLYHVDRMIVHLKRAGMLQGISGLVVGHFSDMKDNLVPFGENAYEMIRRNVQEADFPVAFGFPVGHASPNMPLPVGSNVKLNVGEQGTMLDFS